MTVRRVAVLGAGNGGCAAAADLTLRGFDIRLYSRSKSRLAPIIERGGLELTGVAGEGFVPLPRVTDDLPEAIAGAEILLVTVPTFAHPFYAAALAPIVQPDQIIMLNPGHMGALFVAHEIYRRTQRRDLRLCEVMTLTYGALQPAPAAVNIVFRTGKLFFAAFPGKYQNELAEIIKPLYPAIVPAKNALASTFVYALNATLHPPQTICNAGWVEHTGGDFPFYYDGTTVAVGCVIDALDRERMALAAALRVPVSPFVQEFFESGLTSENAMRIGKAHYALRESAPNRWSKGPNSLDHRYLHEDVGWGLVAWAEMGRALGVPTPVADALITLASVMNEIDYRREGLTLAKLGLHGKDLRKLDEFLYEGIR